MEDSKEYLKEQVQKLKKENKMLKEKVIKKILKALLTLAFGRGESNPKVLSHTILSCYLLQGLIEPDKNDCFVLSKKGKRFISEEF